MMIAYLIIGYLIGSIPFGLLLTKCAGLGDIRNIGSGNIGATNVLRTGRKSLAIATLLFDLFKGTLAVSIAYSTHDTLMMLLVGVVAILGHVFPIWLKFKGGKGVATSIGVLLGAVPITGILCILVWLGMAFKFRISSLAALTSLLIAPIATFFIYGIGAACIVLLISALVWWRHKDNIKRLLKGEEAKISFRSPDASAGP